MPLVLSLPIPQNECEETSSSTENDHAKKEIDAPISTSTMRTIIKKPSRAGCRLRFTTVDDMDLVRYMEAAKAHLASNGKTKERSGIETLRASAIEKLTCTVI